MKLGVVFNEHKLSGKLTYWFTGCYAYHTVWFSEEDGVMYDMHLLRRRRSWPAYTEAQILSFDVPQVTKNYLEQRLTFDESEYGVLDYTLFFLRPLYHLFGKSTRNAGGTICSEMINQDMRACGVDTPWELDVEPPSPCDIFRWLSRST